MMQDDLAVFFADLSVTLVHVESGSTFQAIKGQVDVDALDGYALNAEVQLRYATDEVAMRQGDKLDELDANGDFVAAWRLLEHPKRLLDGLESTVILGRAD